MDDAANEENGALSCNTSEAANTDQNEVLLDKPTETELQLNGDIVVEEQPQLTLVQEPIAAEH